MNKQWQNAIITDISIALYIPPEAGIKSRSNRPFHGFILNDPEGSVKTYHFKGGQAIRVEPGELCYLPKNTCYRVETVSSGGCWLIDFDLLSPLKEKPFVVSFKNPATVLETFKEAETAFRFGGENRDLTVRRALYDIILRLLKEQSRNFVPNSKMQLLQPALERINGGFADRTMTVHALAAQCDVSDTYFRRIFGQCMGISPQEYIIERRIQYAKQLLRNGQLPILEIAQLCGYTELSHFSREFTKRTGMSPRTYTKEL